MSGTKSRELQLSNELNEDQRNALVSLGALASQGIGRIGAFATSLPCCPGIRYQFAGEENVDGPSVLLVHGLLSGSSE